MNQTTADTETIYTAITGLLEKHGYTIRPYSQFLQRYPDAAFLPEKFPYGFMNVTSKVILINDATPDGEQIFTLCHEIGHIVTGDNHDEDAADRIAVWLCQGIEALTGIVIDAEPMQGHCYTHRNSV